VEDLETRAARHGALADPTRLAVVDLLGHGDASSRELQDALGLPSNLMAHHLGTLERVGLVRRRRSEADRRRSYVQLVREALPLTAAGLTGTGLTEAAGDEAPESLVFICTGNSARSQLAAAFWNARAGDGPQATSAGTHPADRIAPGALSAARRRGLELVGRPTALTGTPGEESLVVTVCDSAHEELAGALAGRPTGRTLHWSVPDPVRLDTDAAFETAAEEIDQRVRHLLTTTHRHDSAAPDEGVQP